MRARCSLTFTMFSFTPSAAAVSATFISCMVAQRKHLPVNARQVRNGFPQRLLQLLALQRLRARISRQSVSGAGVNSC